MITIDPPSTSRTAAFPLSTPALARFLRRASTLVGLPAGVSVLLTSDSELKRLNRTFRGKNKPTDVLSFPAEPVPGVPATHQHPGDLAISLETAGRQAEHFGHPLQSEIKVLMLHGLLHLAGFDHETDSGQMAAREAELRTRLRLSAGLIDRTLGRAPARHPPRRPPSATKTVRPTRRAAP